MHRCRTLIAGMLVVAAWLPAISVWGVTPALNLGLYFPENNSVPLDFLNVPILPPANFMEPWRLTDPSNRFVSEGALAGMSERDVQLEILKGVQERYYSVPTPIGTELKVNFQLGKVSGPNTINVVFGKFNDEADRWFGLADYREAFDKPKGGTMAAVAIDELATLKVKFDTLDKVINAIVNVAAHEIGHMYGLQHVCAGPNCRDSVPGCPIVSNPYDLMATGPSGLPEEGWIARNVFTDVPGTQSGGLSSIGTLVSGMGVRTIADADYDGDVDTNDLLTLMEGWTGAMEYGDGRASFERGDTDHDFDVDSSDVLNMLEHWTGASAASNSNAIGLTATGSGAFGMASLNQSAGFSAGNFAYEPLELSATAMVPEPSSSGWLAVASSAVALLHAGRRRR